MGPSLRPLDLLVVGLLALAGRVAVPFHSNQNQYLAHAVGAQGALADDWFVSTTDPYPVFTAVMRATLLVGGEPALRILAVVLAGVALLAVRWLALLLAPRAEGRTVALVATVMVGLTMLASFDLAGQAAPAGMSAFRGLAGQYLLSKPGYVQPSTFGVLMLLAVPAWLAARQGAPGERRRYGILTAALATAACVLHPTYLVVLAVGLGSGIAVDVAKRRSALVASQAAAGLAVLVVTLATNPGVVSLGTPSPDAAVALQRFAFERIPHHTLYPRWPPTDVLLLAVVLAAVLVLLWRGQRWLAGVLALSTTVGLAAALLVEATGSATVALLFPWRASVIVVPVAVTVLAVELAVALHRLIGSWLRWVAVVAAAALAAVGVAASAAAHPPAVSDDATRAVRAAAVSGVGLIPLQANQVRLNAPAAVYVDWKSPPYAGDDLVEWWRRVDQVRQVAAQPDDLCDASWFRGIDWVLTDDSAALPSCVASWNRTADSSGSAQVLVRP